MFPLTVGSLQDGSTEYLKTDSIEVISFEKLDVKQI